MIAREAIEKRRGWFEFEAIHTHSDVTRKEMKECMAICDLALRPSALIAELRAALEAVVADDVNQAAKPPYWDRVVAAIERAKEAHEQDA